MKTVPYILLVLLFLIPSLLMVACNDLSLQPLDQITENSYYQTVDDFDGAILASYSSLAKLWETSTETLGERGEYWKLTLTTTDDVAVDNVLSPGILRDLDQLRFRPGDVHFQATYSMIYEGIMRANLVLDKLGGENELTEEQKTRLEGEAKFMRAFFHFQALKMWGTPPLVLEVKQDLNNLAQPNADQSALFDQILSDFQTASETLPGSWDAANRGRATSWAALAFAGKVNVWREDWPAAIALFEDVINNGPYRLLDNYGDVFAFDNENNAESIFEIQYGGPFKDDNMWVFDDIHSEATKASQGTGRPWYWRAGGSAPGGHNGWYPPSQDLLDAYEPGDERLDVNIYKEGDTYWTNGTYEGIPYDPSWSTTDLVIKKYGGKRNTVPNAFASHGQAGFNNERWYRFAELKLLYAEALIETGRDDEARQQINDIRNRAGLSNLDTGVDLVEALRHEKRVEMAFEPHRWFDITRWGIGPEIFGSEWDDHLKLFPFPQSEIDRSDGTLQQNPGY